MSLKISLLFVILLSFEVRAQMPDTEVWLFEVKRNKEGRYSVQKPVNVSQRKGYDNQPSFSEAGDLLYYVSDVNAQTDIYVYSLRKKHTTRFTATQESEYSPRPVPGSTVDKAGRQAATLISAVTVEEDSAQRLHFFTEPTGSNLNKLGTDSIGYYYFLNADTLVFYKLTQPHTLRWMTKSDTSEHFLANRPARCFQAIDRHTMLYGVKDSARVTYFSYDFVLKRATRVAEHVPGSEDLFWHRELGLLVAYRNEILQLNRQTGGWEPLISFASSGITRITRFVFDRSGKYIALVDNPGSR